MIQSRAIVRPRRQAPFKTGQHTHMDFPGGTFFLAWVQSSSHIGAGTVARDDRVTAQSTNDATDLQKGRVRAGVSAISATINNALTYVKLIRKSGGSMSNIEQIPLTRDGHQALQKELETLRTVERPGVIEAIAEARSHGDLKENAEYHAAREKQGMIEARISDLEDKLSRAQIVDFSGGHDGTVRFGSWVCLQDEQTGEEKKYRIVGDLEADISSNLVSISSPIARALLGKQIDDLVRIKAPKGDKEYVILEIG